MLTAERYAQARQRAHNPENTQDVFVLLCQQAEKRPPGAYLTAHITLHDGVVLRCLVSWDTVEPDSDRREQHLSVSRTDGKTPSWDDLVTVRALAWPDDVRVLQHLPPGDEPWVSVPGVEVLHLWRVT